MTTRELQTQWRVSNRRIPETELLVVFPEARDIIPAKIAEWKKQRGALADAAREKLVGITRIPDEVSRFFWIECLKWLQIPKILEMDRHIVRLTRLLRDPLKAPASVLNARELETARQVPIASLLPPEHRLRTGHKTISTNCPLHPDRTPSFHIYRATNTFWCFGCSQGGDAITFAMTLNKLPFKEAVLWLLRGR